MARVLKHNVGDEVLIVVRGHIKSISIASSDDCTYVVELGSPSSRRDDYKDLLYFTEKGLEDHEYHDPRLQLKQMTEIERSKNAGDKVQSDLNGQG